jgi:hypothetical protein
MWIVVIAIIVVAFLWWLVSKKGKESFKVLGTLAPYNQVYYKCLSDCERSDPGKRLTPTKGSMACQEYCDSTLTDISRRDGPSYPEEYPIAPLTISTEADDAYKICGEGTKGNWCRQIYFTDREIDEKCRQDCKYSTQTTEECMDLCAKARSANKSTGWSWK